MRIAFGAADSLRRRVHWRVWMPPVGLTLAMWWTVGYVRPVADWFRSRGILADTIWAVFAVLALVFAGLGWKEGRSLSDPSRRERLRGVILILLGAGVYAWAMTGLVVAPEERIHFILVGSATGLYHRLFRIIWPAARWVPVLTFLAGAGVGGIEEWLQKLYPTRYFDWRDVGMNVLAAFLAVSMIHLLSGRRGARGTGLPAG